MTAVPAALESTLDTSALPARPLTVGELLDAALLLLRTHAAVLLPVAAALALLEQAALAPIRSWAFFDFATPWPSAHRLGEFWLLLCAGAGFEAAIVALLAAPASRAAGALLVGRRLPHRALLDPRGVRVAATVPLAAVAGVVVGVGSLAGPLWAVVFPLVALAVPALVIDRVNPFRALLRGAGLAGRSGARAGWILLLGYLTWWVVRLLVGTGGGYALAELVPVDAGTEAVLAAGLRAAANTLAYAALACLAAAVHLETRMRTEGLDIQLSRRTVRDQDHLAVRA